MVDDRVQGEFNSALEYLRRISEAFTLCNEGSGTMNSYLWITGLVTAFKELSTKMKDDERDARLVELRGLVNDVNNVKVKGGKSNIDKGIYWRCFDFELFLRRVFSEAGLEMKVKDDAKNVLFKGGY